MNIPVVSGIYLCLERMVKLLILHHDIYQVKFF